jgi:hypothetical protein
MIFLGGGEACSSWEIVLNVNRSVSFHNTLDWKGMWEKEDEINSVKTRITNHETFH